MVGPTTRRLLYGRFQYHDSPLPAVGTRCAYIIVVFVNLTSIVSGFVKGVMDGKYRTKRYTEGVSEIPQRLVPFRRFAVQRRHGEAEQTGSPNEHTKHGVRLITSKFGFHLPCVLCTCLFCLIRAKQAGSPTEHTQCGARILTLCNLFLYFGCWRCVIGGRTLQTGQERTRNAYVNFIVSCSLR